MLGPPHDVPSSPRPGAWRASEPTLLGKLLQKHRSRAGYSQAFLAERAHISLETIGALERGTRQAPYADTLELLIDALDLIGEERLAFRAAASVARDLRAVRRAGTSARGTSLPTQLTPLVGRDEEITRIGALIAKQRLVTITGCSGLGKTRVAIEVATHFARDMGEVWLVDLAALDRNASVLANVASAIGVNAMSADFAARLGAKLGTRKALIVFDSCEHVIAETATTALTLIRACPAMNVLVASSERLGVPGEMLVRLTSLAIPDRLPSSIEEARRYSAIALFIDRAEAQVNVDIRADKLPAIVEICRRLDGVPRGIELAAARLAALGFENLLLRLNERLVLSGGGRDLAARKQAPREAIEWSYAGLSALEQTLFRRLAIFVGSHTLEDSEAVCADDALEPGRVAEVLDSLVHKSLVVLSRSKGTVSYRVLEFARTYGLEKLAECGELERYSERRALWLENAARVTAAELPGS